MRAERPPVLAATAAQREATASVKDAVHGERTSRRFNGDPEGTTVPTQARHRPRKAGGTVATTVTAPH